MPLPVRHPVPTSIHVAQVTHVDPTQMLLVFGSQRAACLGVQQKIKWTSNSNTFSL